MADEELKQWINSKQTGSDAMMPKAWNNTENKQLAERVYAAAGELINAIDNAKQNGMTVVKPERWGSDNLREHLCEIQVRRDYDRGSREVGEETK